MKIDGRQAWILGALGVWVGMNLYSLLLAEGTEAASSVLTLDKDIILLVIGYLFRMGSEAKG